MPTILTSLSLALTEASQLLASFSIVKMADWEIPLSPEDVTIDWLQRTLQKSLQTQVEVRTLATIKTDGYLSTACQAKIKQCTKDEEEKLFLKITLPSQDPFQSFISTHNIDLNEVNAYRKTLPALMDFEKSKLNYSRLEKIIPRFYAGKYNFLILARCRIIFCKILRCFDNRFIGIS